MNLNRQSPIPLWVGISVGVIVTAAIFFSAKSTTSRKHATPEPRPHLLAQTEVSGLEATPSSPSTVLSLRPPSFSTIPQSVDSPHGETDDSSESTSSRIVGDLCSDGMKNFDPGEPAVWPTYTNAEDFYSIGYPALGTFIVRYTARPKETILSWQGVGCFTVEIGYTDPNGLTFAQWLAKLDVSPGEAETTSVNDMTAVIQRKPEIGLVRVFLERMMPDGSPIIYSLDFRESDYGQIPPPFWRAMLLSFRPIPIMH